MSSWLKAHGIKIIAILTSVQMLLTGIGDNPLVSLLGAHTEAIITLATGIVTTLLTFLAPGQKLGTAPTIPPAS